MDESKENKRNGMVGLISTMCVLALFAIMALVLINVGVRVYKNVVLANNNNFELRTSLSYISTKIKENDRAGMVDVREIDGKTALVITEEFDGDLYDTLIYHSDGKLYELATLRGYSADFDGAFEVLEVDSLEIEKEDNVIHLTSKDYDGDTAELFVTLRSSEAAASAEGE